FLIFAAGAVPAAAQQTHLVVVTGVSVDDKDAQTFSKWANTFIDTAKKKESIPDSNITFLADKAATKVAVEKAFADRATKSKPNDEILILLIGHGSYDGRVAAFNLMGPDPNADDFAKMLARFTTQRIVFVNTTSSSGEFLKPLAGPGRIIVTA